MNHFFTLLTVASLLGTNYLSADDTDAFEYDLFDRMRSGKVFNDSNYPPPEEECPACQRRRQNNHQNNNYHHNPRNSEHQR